MEAPGGGGEGWPKCSSISRASSEDKNAYL